MVQGLYHHLREVWKKPSTEMLKSRMIQWRAGNSVVKVEKPLRLDRARALGYKAKKGILVARVKLIRGGRHRPRFKRGRKTSNMTIRKTLKMNYQWVAEMRAAKKYHNLEVLNSYQIGQDGKHYFYEVILVDPNATEIKSDKNLSWIANGTNRKRVERGLTSAAKKSRGLRSKSPNMKVRPSLRSWGRKGN